MFIRVVEVVFIISLVLPNMMSGQRSVVVMNVCSDRDGSCCIFGVGSDCGGDDY